MLSQGKTQVMSIPITMCGGRYTLVHVNDAPYGIDETYAEKKNLLKKCQSVFLVNFLKGMKLLSRK